ncbi:MAG: hypothetical protein R3E01_36270 [Pirellulaceae bacterium]
MRELESLDRLKPLVDFAHLIVRIGCVGAVHISRAEGDSNVKKVLFFDATARHGFHRDPETHGHVVGANSVFATCIMRSLLGEKRLSDQVLRQDELIGRGIGWAIDASQKHYDHGYGFQFDEDEPYRFDYKFPNEILLSLHEDDPQRRITKLDIPVRADWKITDNVRESNLVEASLRYCVIGGDDVAGRPDTERLIRLMDGSPPLFAPVVAFGKLLVVDRDEIEGYRSIHQLLRDYLDDSSNDKPISLAVFGPPGSGKSFGVRQVAETLLSSRSGPPEVFNLAQFSDPNQLGEAFLKIRSRKPENVPLAFFDEFDSTLGGTHLGWLRYFLGPMEDGDFFVNKSVHKTGRAILVFAGGTSESLASFTRHDSSEEERGRFTNAKGPDFLSRLSGSISVLGVNRRDDTSDSTFVLRRAVVIRSILENLGLIGRSQRSLVDRDFLRKLLEVERFLHGSRSVEKVMKMCIGMSGVLHLPPSDQLRMHVSPSDVKTLLGEGSRTREQSALLDIGRFV